MSKNLLKDIIQSFKQLFTGQFILSVVGFIAAFYYAKLLGPSDYGTWQTAKIFTQYSMLLAFGLPFVMRRDFIQLRSEGKEEEANKMAYQVFTFLIISSFLFSAIIFSLAFWNVNDKNFSNALITVGIINLFNIFIGFGDIINKGLNNYGVLRNSKIVVSFFTLTTIGLVWSFGFNGLLAGLILSSTANSIYYILKRPIKFHLYWDFNLLKKMIFIGFPIYLQNIVQVIFTSIDRLIIAGYLSFEVVGYYSLSGLLNIPITLIVSTLGIVVFTQLTEAFGKEQTKKVIRLHMEVPQQIILYSLTPLLIIGIIWLPYVVTLFLPNYIQGIEAAQIFVFAILFLTLAGFSSNALFILDKQKMAALSFGIAGIVKTIGSVFFLKMGFGIEAIASVTLFAYFLYDFLMVIQVNRSLKLPLSVRFILAKNTPIIYTVFALILTEYMVDHIDIEKLLIKYILKTIIYLILLVPYIFIARKKLNPIFYSLKHHEEN